MTTLVLLRAGRSIALLVLLAGCWSPLDPRMDQYIDTMCMQAGHELGSPECEEAKQKFREDDYRRLPF